MATEKQILANQQNAMKSTGPTTPEGKAVSSKNALKFGQRTLALLPGEDEAAFEMLAGEYYNYLQPVGPVETSLVTEMIRCDWWRQQRSVQVETNVLAGAMKEKGTFEVTDRRERLKALVYAHLAGRRGEETTTAEDESQISSAFTGSCQMLERIQRYATIYDNRYYRALHELIRLQAARRGQKVVPPVAVDVTVTNPEPPE